MANKYKTGDEPVPGYRLVEITVHGGFGEVWKATAPDGALVAIKILAVDQIQGMKESKALLRTVIDMVTMFAEQIQGMKELKALLLVKTVRHPNLAPVQFWIKDSSGREMNDEQIEKLVDDLLGSASAKLGSMTAELIVATKLGGMSLLERLQECLADGHDGIPPDELLGYMDGVAKAIDFLKSRHNIQHCDIKPQNITIVGDLAQIREFGLARSLSDTSLTAGGGTIAYGAPEVLCDNKPSMGTDQYSLALTYYELRTGRLPFSENSGAMAVLMMHREGKLDFTALSEDERAVIKRATSPDPSQRFAQCADMVQALRQALVQARDARQS